MKNGEFPEGKYTLRAKIDLASGNFNMRDPVLYRINYIAPPPPGAPSGASTPCTTSPTPSRTPWRASPTPCAPWSLRTTAPCTTGSSSNTDVPSKPRQIEFARLGINYTVMSKRKLRKLVEEGYVSGWDDPRMPTLCGLRRRGYTPGSIRNFCERIGVAKATSTVEYAFLEHCLREDLNEHAQRAMAVLRPVKLTITNYPEGQSETFDGGEQPQRPGGRHPPSHLLPAPVCGGGGLPGDPGPQVQAALPRRP